MSDKTLADVAEIAPEAGPLLLMISEHNAAMREAALPTWEMLQRERNESYDRGFQDGYDRARSEIYERLFGGWESRA